MSPASRKALLVRVFVLITSLILTQALLTFEPALAGGGEAHAVEEIITPCGARSNATAQQGYRKRTPETHINFLYEHQG